MRIARPLLPALVALGLLAPAAQAAPPGLNLGTEIDPNSPANGQIDPGDVQMAADLGAKSVRIFVDWAQLEPSGPTTRQTQNDRWGTLERSVAKARQLRIVPVLVVLHAPQWANGTTDVATPPREASSFAGFMGRIAGQLAASDPVWEIWNEQDEAHFWTGAPEPARYAQLLKAANAAVKNADPQATVLFGALTGNNYGFFEAAFDQGRLGAGDFDGVAVHTDTACLVRPPDFYVRNVGPGLDGRINRFSFLGFRELQGSMERRGVGDKGIWMTELGWSTFTGACEVPGVEAGRLGGVSPAQQALNITKAYQCLANYPYVKQALVFDAADRGAGRINQYGILGKPAQSAFEAIPDDGGPGGECGDFTAPTVTPIVPVTEFSGPLRVHAKATDPSGVTRITMKIDGKEIRNFTGDAVGNDKVVGLDPWDGAKNLAPGEHTLTFEAIDAPSNLGVAEVKIRKVDPSKLKQTNRTKVVVRSVKARKGKGQLKATITRLEGTLELKGKLQAVWETKRPRKVKGKRKLVWTKVHGGLTSVTIKPTGRSKTVTFRSVKLKYKRYRVRVKYLGKSPYAPSRSPYKTFKR